MQFIPSIVLKGGECVYQLQVHLGSKPDFSNNPFEVIVTLYRAGARRLHIVDLDGAVADEPRQKDIIYKIMRYIEEERLGDLKIQVAGGVREMEQLKRYINNASTDRIVLGTKAILEPRFLKVAAREWPDQILLGLDVKDGKLAIPGWEETIDTTAEELLKRVKDMPLAGVVFTDISRAGTTRGVSIDKTLEFAKKTSFPVIASGGISSIGDLRMLIDEAKEEGVSLGGVIAGRALYEGRLNCIEAVSECKKATPQEETN